MTPAQRASHAGRTLYAYGHNQPLPINGPQMIVVATAGLAVAAAAFAVGRLSRRREIVVSEPVPPHAEPPTTGNDGAR